MENNIIKSIIDNDKQLLVYLNNLGQEKWDSFWLFITNKFVWIPLFIFVFIIIFKKIGKPKSIFILLFIILLIAFSDMFTNFIKASFERLRPCNDITLKNQIRFIINSKGYSFWSAHASTSTMLTTFIILILKKYNKIIYLLIIFPFLFAYSRIYLAVHYPLDVFFGSLFGLFFGNIFYRFFYFLSNKFF